MFKPTLITIPTKVETVFYKIRSIGGRPIIFGGAVRDALMGIENSDTDFDIEVHGDVTLAQLHATLWAIDDVKDLGIFEAGKAFGVLKVRFGGWSLDISFPRRDSKIGPGHRGFVITQDSNISMGEATARRDFTVNAIGWDSLTGEIIDCHGGLEDLDNKILRHTSEAFSEDPLRVLRAVQFAARFGFTIAPETAALCFTLSISELPQERIWMEFWKMGTKGIDISAALRVLEETCWEDYFPQLAKLHYIPQDQEWHSEGNVWIHSGMAADKAAWLWDEGNRDGSGNLEDRFVIVFAALCHDMGKITHTQIDGNRIRSLGHAHAGVPIAKEFLKSIGCPNHLMIRILALVAEHMRAANIDNPSNSAVRRLARKLSLSNVTIKQWALVCCADCLGREPQIISESLNWLGVARNLTITEKPEKGILNGHMLIAAGLKPGPIFSEILRDAIEAQDNGEFDNEDGAICWLMERINQ